MTGRRDEIKFAPLKNIANFNGLMDRVINRGPHISGMACFHGYSGYGKTSACIQAANRYRAAYIDVGPFIKAGDLLSDIVKELGEPKPKGTIANKVAHAIEIMAADPDRPLIVDEAHNLRNERMIDVMRELHEKSQAPVILVGEETLPGKLMVHERVHNRIIEWVPAQPCDLEDAEMILTACYPALNIAEDLIAALVKETGGNTRRIVFNLDRIDQLQRREPGQLIGLAAFPVEMFHLGKPPRARRVQ